MTKCELLLDIWKYKCIHIRHGNVIEECNNGDTILGTSVKDKDLGLRVSADKNISEQCRFAASKCNQVLGLTRRNMTNKETHLIVSQHKAIVGPHLEYCIQAWRPYRIEDHRQ